MSVDTLGEVMRTTFVELLQIQYTVGYEMERGAWERDKWRRTVDALDLSVLSIEFGRILSFQSRLSIHYKDFSCDLGVSQSPFRNCTAHMYVNP